MSQDQSRPHRGPLAPAERQLPVHYHVFHTDRIPPSQALVPGVSNPARIEHGQVSAHTRPQNAAIPQPEPTCGFSCHLAHRFLKPYHTPFTNIVTEDSGKGPVRLLHR